MKKQIKILHIMNGATLGGISTVVLNYYENIDRNRFQFDCAMYNTNLGPNGLKLKALGSNFYELPLKSKHPFSFIIKLIRILKGNGYDAIHVHSNNTSYLALIIAKILGISVRIAHAHTARDSAGYINKLKNEISFFITPRVATHLLGCSNEALTSMFGKADNAKGKMVLLKNAIDVNKFKYNVEVREKIRAELGIRDEFTIGTVGNLLPEKNHKYLLKIFHEINKVNQTCKLIIVGQGDLLEDLKSYSINLEIEDKVLFLGRRTDVNEILSAFDVFVLPSLYEGFAIAGLEACASGLPVFLSDGVPEDLNCFSNVKYLSINSEPSLWAKEITNVQLSNSRLQSHIEAKNCGYEIELSSRKLESIYANSFSIHNT